VTGEPRERRERRERRDPSRAYEIPKLCMIVLVGASGSGKSTFARKHFLPSEIVSSDACRAMVSDDENDQSATDGAFALVHAIAAERLKFGKLVVIDATNVAPESRRPLIALAREHHVLPIAVVIETPERVCQDRNDIRTDRTLGSHVVRNQMKTLRRGFPNRKEGFHSVIVLKGDEIETAQFERAKMWNDKRDLRGPFDLIGDVHGCFDELVSLLTTMGWVLSADRTDATHPEGRTAVFLGDLVDRGPATPAVLRLAMNMAASGAALCIPGNHEHKLLRALRGADVKRTHGLGESLAQLALEPESFRTDVTAFIDKLVSHLILDDGRLVVAHAGIREDMQGRSSGAVRSFCLYGDTTGETDDYGFPVRYPWADEYRGKATVVYGHTPIPDAVWVNNTICVDTGVVFGGALTALKWPERELVSVPALRVHYEPTRPLVAVAEVPARTALDLDLDDVLGKRRIETSLGGVVTVREDQAAAAIEVMSRFAADPRWLVYLPPTMAPPSTSSLDGYLEHPAEAFAQFKSLGVRQVICEEKHMGSRAVVIVGRTMEAISARFGITDPAGGIVLTRTGRRFFNDDSWTAHVVDRVRVAATSAGIWEELATDWLVIDAELLPWSAKAEDLLRRQYAAVGAASSNVLRRATSVLEDAAARLNSTEVGLLLARSRQRESDALQFVDAYRQYCWDVDGPQDLQLAPFQILAAEGEVHARRGHLWHLDLINRMRTFDSAFFRETRYRIVDLEDLASVAAATQWWLGMTGAGGEGMVVKPIDAIVGSGSSLVQPGVKVRGREYLRIIYGPEYTDPRNLERLRVRSLGHKRSLALREFSLGIESLDRFVAREPLFCVHECAFAVLAMETDPVDPRL
jgi:protein phosphatase